jgi:hypothetical protein
VAQKEIARKHGNADEMSETAAPGPDINLGQKQVKSLRCQLIVDELLAMAAGPEDVPPQT